MERHVQRDLEILTAISEGTSLTQRDLAHQLGVALGLERRKEAPRKKAAI